MAMKGRRDALYIPPNTYLLIIGRILQALAIDVLLHQSVSDLLQSIRCSVPSIDECGPERSALLFISFNDQCLFNWLVSICKLVLMGSVMRNMRNHGIEAAHSLKQEN
jgi:hypothetical protein